MQIPPVGNELTQIAPSGLSAAVSANTVNTEATQPTLSPARLALVDVVSIRPDGRALVRIDNQEEAVVAGQGLVAGGRYVLEIEPTPTSLVLRPPTDSPSLPNAIAGAILRASQPPDLGAALGPLLAELAGIQQGEHSHEIREQASAVSTALRSLVRGDGRPLASEQLQSLVDDGGLYYEAKLARLDPRDAVPANVRSDLKGALLQLLQAARDIGSSETLPAARTALNGIEAQQAANVVAQADGTPYFLQVPFPDGDQWRTLNLAIESEAHENAGLTATRSFRLLLHVSLSELGEAWIDAGVSRTQFRAIIYLDRPEKHDLVRVELPDLQSELRSDGFGEVLLDVRPAFDLPNEKQRLSAAMRAGRPDSLSLLDVKV